MCQTNLQVQILMTKGQTNHSWSMILGNLGQWYTAQNMQEAIFA
jgi:hypothetical protein